MRGVHTLSEPNGLDFRVGQLDGRVSTMESRMDRYEIEMRARLISMDLKLDSLISSRAERNGILRFQVWIIGLFVTILGLVIGGAHQIKDLFTTGIH